MFSRFRAAIDRIRALLARAAGLEAGADAAARHADPKAPLLRLAEMLDLEGLHASAQELRQLAEALARRQSMAGAAASLADWEGLALHPALPAPPRQSVASIPEPGGRKAR